MKILNINDKSKEIIIGLNNKKIIISYPILIESKYINSWEKSLYKKIYDSNKWLNPKIEHNELVWDDVIELSPEKILLIFES